MFAEYMHPTSMSTLDNKSIAAHVIVVLAQVEGRVVCIDELASEIGVRKEDVRHVVTRLHAEGHVDALRLRLTMSGLALAASLEGCKLREPRHFEEPIARVA